MNEVLLEMKGVVKTFGAEQDLTDRLQKLIGISTKEKRVTAVNCVDLSIYENEVLGLVGESGSGKSTLGRIAAGLMQPTSGDILYEGRSINNCKDRDHMRRHMLDVQMVFQDPLASLNPRMRIGDIIGEAPRVHGIVDKSELDDYVEQMMLLVGLDPSFRDRFPHQFSGGQRQRVGIARALAVKPKVLICDEAVSALDVSVQAQILNLFAELKDELNLTYLFISHDLSVVEHLCDRVAILYLGRVAELGPANQVFCAPGHPYTKALIDDAPDIMKRGQVYTPVAGEMPSPMAPPSGCFFHPRCGLAKPKCSSVIPVLQGIGERHESACLLNDEIQKGYSTNCSNSVNR